MRLGESVEARADVAGSRPPVVPVVNQAKSTPGWLGSKWFLVAAVAIIGLFVVNEVGVGMSFAETASKTEGRAAMGICAAFFVAWIVYIIWKGK